MKKTLGLLLFALSTTTGQAANKCTIILDLAKVVDVHGLQQTIQIPEMETHCVNGRCESGITRIHEVETEPRFELILKYQGENYSVVSPLAPSADTVLVEVKECSSKPAKRRTSIKMTI